MKRLIKISCVSLIRNIQKRRSNAVLGVMRGSLQVNIRVCLSAIWCLFGQKGSLLCSLSSTEWETSHLTRVSLSRPEQICPHSSSSWPLTPSAAVSRLCIIWRVCRRSAWTSCWCRKWRDDCVVMEAWNTWGGFGMMSGLDDSLHRLNLLYLIKSIQLFIYYKPVFIYLVFVYLF